MAGDPPWLASIKKMFRSSKKEPQPSRPAPRAKKAYNLKTEDDFSVNYPGSGRQIKKPGQRSLSAANPSGNKGVKRFSSMSDMRENATAGPQAVRKPAPILEGSTSDSEKPLPSSIVDSRSRQNQRAVSSSMLHTPARSLSVKTSARDLKAVTSRASLKKSESNNSSKSNEYLRRGSSSTNFLSTSGSGTHDFLGNSTKDTSFSGLSDFSLSENNDFSLSSDLLDFGTGSSLLDGASASATNANKDSLKKEEPKSTTSTKKSDRKPVTPANATTVVEKRSLEPPKLTSTFLAAIPAVETESSLWNDDDLGDFAGYYLQEGGREADVGKGLEPPATTTATATQSKSTIKSQTSTASLPPADTTTSTSLFPEISYLLNAMDADELLPLPEESSPSLHDQILQTADLATTPESKASKSSSVSSVKHQESTSSLISPTATFASTATSTTAASVSNSSLEQTTKSTLLASPISHDNISPNTTGDNNNNATPTLANPGTLSKPELQAESPSISSLSHSRDVKASSELSKLLNSSPKAIPISSDLATPLTSSEPSHPSSPDPEKVISSTESPNTPNTPSKPDIGFASLGVSPSSTHSVSTSTTSHAPDSPKEDSYHEKSESTNAGILEPLESQSVEESKETAEVNTTNLHLEASSPVSSSSETQAKDVVLDDKLSSPILSSSAQLNDAYDATTITVATESDEQKIESKQIENVSVDEPASQTGEEATPNAEENTADEASVKETEQVEHSSKSEVASTADDTVPPVRSIVASTSSHSLSKPTLSASTSIADKLSELEMEAMEWMQDESEGEEESPKEGPEVKMAEPTETKVDTDFEEPEKDNETEVLSEKVLKTVEPEHLADEEESLSKIESKETVEENTKDVEISTTKEPSEEEETDEAENAEKELLPTTEEESEVKKDIVTPQVIEQETPEKASEPSSPAESSDESEKHSKLISEEDSALPVAEEKSIAEQEDLADSSKNNDVRAIDDDGTPKDTTAVDIAKAAVVEAKVDEDDTKEDVSVSKDVPVEETPAAPVTAHESSSEEEESGEEESSEEESEEEDDDEDEDEEEDDDSDEEEDSEDSEEGSSSEEEEDSEDESEDDDEKAVSKPKSLSKKAFVQPEVFLYTSLATASHNMHTHTTRMAFILDSYKIKYTGVDLGTDNKARRVWKWRSNGRQLPALVRDDQVICDLKELEEWSESREVWERVIEDDLY